MQTVLTNFERMLQIQRFMDVRCNKFPDQQVSDQSTGEEEGGQFGHTSGDNDEQLLSSIVEPTQYKSLAGFDSLPPEMKTHLFSFLTPCDRGRAALVSHEWRDHMYDPTVWTVVDLTTFPTARLCPLPPVPPLTSGDGEPVDEPYELYRASVHAFLNHLSAVVEPIVRVLRIMLDIGDVKDGWNEDITELLKKSRLHQLHTVMLIWNRTPLKMLTRRVSQDITDSSVVVPSIVSATSRDIEEQDEEEEPFMSVEVTHKLRYTQRRFVNLFELLTTRAPTIKRLSLPFDWSTRSCDLLGSLKHLSTLVLHRYSLFAHVEPATINRLLVSLPLLTRLSIELWLSSGAGVTKLQFHSTSLQYLDLGRCRGVYVDSVNLPAATVVKLSHRPWNDCGLIPRQIRRRTRSFCRHTDEQDEESNVGGAGGGGVHDARAAEAPPKREECIYKILCRGAPHLRQLNEHILRPDWTTLIGCYEELDLVLGTICICPLHTAIADDDWVV